VGHDGPIGLAYFKRDAEGLRDAPGIAWRPTPCPCEVTQTPSPLTRPPRSRSCIKLLFSSAKSACSAAVYESPSHLALGPLPLQDGREPC